VTRDAHRRVLRSVMGVVSFGVGCRHARGSPEESD
jgi:hypothetical protein